MPESFRQWREEKRPSLQERRPPTLTVDTAMDIDMVDSKLLQNGDNLSPWPASARKKDSSRSQPSPIPHSLVNESLSISGGRTATPIYGHFTVNMRPERMNEIPHTSNVLCPPTIGDEADWWRRRRLPSPISESGDFLEEHFSEPQTPDYLDSTDKLVWPDSPSSMEVEDDSLLKNTYLQVPEQILEIPARLHSEHQTEAKPQHVEPVAEPAPAPRKGKIGFSMGYRADCEKCRMKIPGHYSHIVRA
ncbi:hypothetical protein BGW36DRAFT_294278 [Talaromyces proteolyticus]|uniref:Uncharacterized protein n=1 Tax=Talaromyces proteolyticus TaxID=1131652 RepID=A0AAD4KSE6_9EURO|nr:uncharacterized protein BGW36DRAFT_294278 [Talaromyces proteolyticus]KAH8698318.1 hypothetical protein BGW36DRAFT_294278 [Talaromyces proteolyticus]